jgi:hypothetical protein
LACRIIVLRYAKRLFKRRNTGSYTRFWKELTAPASSSFDQQEQRQHYFRFLLLCRSMSVLDNKTDLKNTINCDIIVVHMKKAVFFGDKYDTDEKER